MAAGKLVVHRLLGGGGADGTHVWGLVQTQRGGGLLPLVTPPSSAILGEAGPRTINRAPTDHQTAAQKRRARKTSVFCRPVTLPTTRGPLTHSAVVNSVCVVSSFGITSGEGLPYPPRGRLPGGVWSESFTPFHDISDPIGVKSVPLFLFVSVLAGDDNPERKRAP